MASKLNFPSLQELIAAYTSSNQTPDTYKIGAGAVRGQELEQTILNNQLKRQSEELAIKKEIEDLKNKRNQKKKEQAYAESLKQGPVVANLGDKEVHAGQTIQGLKPEDQALADIGEPYTKDVADFKLKQLLASQSDEAKLARAQLRDQGPDKIKQLFQLQDGTTVGVTYGGQIQKISTPGGEHLNPLDKTLPAEQVEKTAGFDSMTDLINRIRGDVTNDKGELSDEGKNMIGLLDAPKGKSEAYTPAADPAKTAFYQKVQDLKNQIIYLRSGKQINEEEYKRLRASLPSEYRDDSIFLSDLANFEKTFQDVAAKRKTAFKEAGYRVPGQPAPASPRKPKFKVISVRPSGSK